MNKGAALVGGVGLGAALMYFFDPDRGKRRREVVRDKVESAGNKVGDYADKVTRDIRTRASEVVSEAKSLFLHEEVTDDVLVERVLLKLGHHLGSVDVQATGGAVILSGSVLADELPELLSTISGVPGVKRVENQLRVLPRSDNGFQGSPEPFGAQA